VVVFVSNTSLAPNTDGLTKMAHCLPALTYGPPIWFKQQKQLSKILQDVQDEAVRWMLAGAGSGRHHQNPLHQLIAILPIHIRVWLQLLSKTVALTLLTILHS
jgi:hypothetical protein